jgi:fibronectin type 3 domain-containing protein
MKKILLFVSVAALAVLLAFAFTACGDEEGEPVGTTLTIKNESGFEITEVLWNNVPFGNITPGMSVTKTVQAGNGFIRFQPKFNPINARTSALIVVEEDEKQEFIFLNTTLVVNADNSANSGTLAGFSEIAILALSQGLATIQNDAITPFDFGLVDMGSNRSLAFTIRNAGNIPLNLLGTPAVTSSSPAFTILTQPPNTTIGPGATASFLVQYSPTAEQQIDTGIITILNNSEGMIFNLAVQGTGHIRRPQITVSQGSTPIAQSGEFDFGSVALGEPKDVIFTIGNIGDANLTFEDVNNNRVNLENNTGTFFTVTTQPSSATAVTPGSTTTFTLRFNPGAVGSNFTATVRVKTNSRDNDEFLFTIKGSSYERIPNPPTGVTATAQSPRNIQVTWNTVAGATRYRVYFAIGSSTAAKTLAGEVIGGVSYTHTGLQPDTQYYYFVTAVNGIGESAHSAHGSGRTQPFTPGGVSAAALSTSSIRITWNAVTGATSYGVYFALSSTGTRSFAGTANEASFTHSSLQPNTTYWYWVTATDSLGTSNHSAAVSARTQALSAPTGVTAQALSARSIQVSWNAVTGVESYRVFYSFSQSGALTLAGTVNSPATSFTHTGLEANTRYFYTLVSATSTGVSGYSTTVNALTQAFSPPTVVTATAQSSSSIRVTWNAVPGATSYEIHSAPSAFGTRSLAGTVAATSTEYIHTGLLPGTYHYFIVAVDPFAKSGFSTSPASATVVMPMPTNVRLEVLSLTSVRLMWNPVSGATSYRVYTEDGNWPHHVYPEGVTESTSFVINNLTPNVNAWDYGVTAINAVGGESEIAWWETLVP